MEILMDYHLVFVLISLFLYFIEIILIFSKPTEYKCLMGAIFASLNIMFCYITAQGFLSIGLISGSTVTAYSAMWMFYMVFYGLALINVAFILYAILRLYKIWTDKLIQPHKSRMRDL
jgi:hypothetical protein